MEVFTGEYYKTNVDVLVDLRISVSPVHYFLSGQKEWRCMCFKHVPTLDCLFSFIGFVKKKKGHLFPTQSQKGKKERKSLAKQYFVFISGTLNLIEKNDGTSSRLQVPKTYLVPENRPKRGIFRLACSFRKTRHRREAGRAESSEDDIGLAGARRGQCWAGKKWSYHSSIHSWKKKKKGNTPSELKMSIDLSPLTGKTLENPPSWGSLAFLLREEHPWRVPTGAGESEDQAGRGRPGAAGFSFPP